MPMNICSMARPSMWSAVTSVSLSCQPMRHLIKPTLLKSHPSVSAYEYYRPYSSLFKYNTNMNAFSQKWCTSFLTPVISTVYVDPPKAGMKLVNNPKRRCKHCYIVIEDEIKYVFCDKFPRHKQATKRLAATSKVARIMTHATQGGRNTSAKMGMWTQQGLREDY